MTNEQGQSIVIVALVFTGLIAIAALVFDGGAAYAQRRRMQNAADAGALAGARRLAQSAADSEIAAAIREYTLTRNGAQSLTATYLPGNQAVGGGTVPASATGVQVVASTSFATFFANWLGEPFGRAAATAKASFGGANNLSNNVLPIAPQCAVANPATLADCGFQFNHSYDIWDGGGPGNFGWLAWHNTEANSSDTSEQTLRENLESPESMVYTNPYTGADHALSIGDWINGTPGVTGGSGVKEQLSALVDSAEPITVILYGQTQYSGSNLQYRIVGFAEFVIEGYQLGQGGGNAHGNYSGCSSGSGNCIQGRFIQYMIAAPVDSQHDFGLVSVHLSN